MNFPPQKSGNNFNLIRLTAAFLVLVGHSVALSGTSITDIPGGRLFIAHFDQSVNVFFFMSGFLLTSSYYRDHSHFLFARSRIYRILPALAVCCFISAFIMGPLFSTLPAAEYFLDRQPYKYFFNNTALTHTEYNLPGVFDSNPYAHAVNGSLWTLKYEIKMYLWLMAMAFLGAFKYRPVFWLCVAVYSGLWFVHSFFSQCFHDPADYDILKRVSLYFFVGVLFWVFFQKIKLALPVVIFLFVASYLSAGLKIGPLVSTLALCYAILFLAFFQNKFVLQFNRLNDISYGYYLYAFPVQQAVMKLFPHTGFYGLIVIAGLITWLLAYLSWNWIEAPILKRCKGLNAGTITPRLKFF